MMDFMITHAEITYIFYVKNNIEINGCQLSLNRVILLLEEEEKKLYSMWFC